MTFTEDLNLGIGMVVPDFGDSGNILESAEIREGHRGTTVSIRGVVLKSFADVVDAALELMRSCLALFFRSFLRRARLLVEAECVDGPVMI